MSSTSPARATASPQQAGPGLGAPKRPLATAICKQRKTRTVTLAASSMRAAPDAHGFFFSAASPMCTVPDDDGFRLNGSNEEVVDLVDCPASAVGTEAQAQHQPAQGVAASASTAGGDGVIGPVG